jgi:hypothetical protein
MQNLILLVRLSYMNEDEIEEELCKRGLQMQYAPWGIWSPWPDAVIPNDLIIIDKPGSMPSRLAWAEWAAEFKRQPYELRRVIDVTAWRMRERDLFMAALNLTC